jgi:hypothetical protein
MKKDAIRIRDLRQKEKYVMDDEYMNGYARLCGWQATITYCSLCRHANKDQFCFPSLELMAEENGVDRKTIMKGLQSLQEWNIVQVQKERTAAGTYRNNTYILVDKSQWKPKPSQVPEKDMDTEPCPSGGLDQVPEKDHKETHIKETHINDINIVTEAGYGNRDVSTLIAYLKEKLQLPMLDGSDKTNRRFCWLALKKFGGADKVRLLIDAAAQDSFWSTRIASFQQLYYKGVQIISKTRGGAGGRPNIRFIDPA